MFILELFFQFAYDISWDKSEPFTHCVMTDGDTNYKIKNKAKKSFMFKNSASVKKKTHLTMLVSIFCIFKWLLSLLCRVSYERINLAFVTKLQIISCSFPWWRSKNVILLYFGWKLGGKSCDFYFPISYFNVNVKVFTFVLEFEVVFV